MKNDKHSMIKNLKYNTETELKVIDSIFLLEYKKGLKPITTVPLISEFINFIKEANLLKGVEGDSNLLLITNKQDQPIYNMGGDLSIFIDKINNKQFDDLYQYMLLIIDGIKIAMNSIKENQITSTIINGDCLAGGMTFALSFDIIVAEKGVQIGFPTAKYGLFTGLGTFELLSRKIGPNKAAEVMNSGRMYSAEEMFDMGMVDYLVEKGEGINVLKEYQEIDLQKRINEINEKHTKFINFNENDLIDSAKHCVKKMKDLSPSQIRLIRGMLAKQQKMLEIYQEDN